MAVALPRYANPARAGFALGLVLLGSFLLAHRGIGASGAFAAAAGTVLDHTSPALVAANPALADRLPSGVALWNDWIVLEIVGVLIGGFASAWFAGRLSWRSHHPSAPRLARALAGGALMGVGARLAYGCTSGLALTGGALLVTGAWIFIPLAFGTAILITLFSRGEV